MYVWWCGKSCGNNNNNNSIFFPRVFDHGICIQYIRNKPPPPLVALIQGGSCKFFFWGWEGDSLNHGMEAPSLTEEGSLFCFRWQMAFQSSWDSIGYM